MLKNENFRGGDSGTAAGADVLKAGAALEKSMKLQQSKKKTMYFDHCWISTLNDFSNPK